LKLIQLGEEYDRLLQNVKLKLQSALTVAEKVKLISLIPCSWSTKKVAGGCDVPQYIVKKGRDLQKTHEILPEAEMKKVALQCCYTNSSSILRE
jgi:hypothetical protein